MEPAIAMKIILEGSSTVNLTYFQISREEIDNKHWMFENHQQPSLASADVDETWSEKERKYKISRRIIHIEYDTMKIAQ